MSRISLIMAAFNAERFLAEAVESALSQTRAPDEIILVDDGSTDGTERVARSFGSRIDYVKQPHRGISITRNLGLRRSSGNLIVFLDADDVWVPRKLEWQEACFLADPELQIGFGHMCQFVDGSRDREVAPEPAILPSAVMIRRALFDRAGLFDDQHRVSEFLDWLMRARELNAKEAVLPQVVLHRRIHNANIGVSRTDEKYREFLRSIKSGLDRRRAAGAP